MSGPAAGDEKRRFERAAGVNVLGNAAKILVEGAAGLAFGSVALLADAAHSVADLVASVVVFVWGGSRYDAADAEHPHGHQRIEPLTALFVGAVIVLLGLNLLRDSIEGLRFGTGVRFSPLLLGALAFAMVDMYVLYRYTTVVNADLGSTALDALAVDCLNDIYTSIAVVVGVIGVFLDVPILDPAAGAVVSLLVVYQGIEIGRENVTYLVGAAPPPGDRDRVVATLRAHPAVVGVHELQVFYDGTDLEVEVHVEVDGGMTLRRAHDIETELVTELHELEGIGDVHVHLDPSGVGEWKDAADAPGDDRGPPLDDGEA